MPHPNATVAASTGGTSVLVVWLATNVFHWSLSAEDGAVIAGGVASIVLFVGRHGLAGVWNIVKHGNQKGK